MGELLVALVYELAGCDECVVAGECFVGAAGVGSFVDDDGAELAVCE